MKEYLKEALDRGYQYVWPRPEEPPRVLFEYGSNILRRLRAYPWLMKTLFPGLRALVTVAWRMRSTALQPTTSFPLPAGTKRPSTSGARR